MNRWIYTIKCAAATIITADYQYAENKSRLGYDVFCRRESHHYRFCH